MEIILIGIIALLIVVLVLVVIRSQTHKPDTPDISGQLQHITNLVLQQLSSHQEAHDRSSQMIHSRIDHATKVVSDVQGKLLQLEEANKRIFDLGKDISSLQNILKAPKLRGGMGEIWLADLIGQIIPSGHFKMQYSFKSGECCDAIIFLRDGLMLPIDSKFSLENFVRMLEAEDGEKQLFKRQFVQDMKKRIDEIAKKYILPQEGTLEFAFMYVPAENVYYQAFIQDEEDMQLLNYAFAKHVIPVSPSSFYAYLQVILFGLRGLEIEKSAKDIQKNINGLQGEFSKFRENYEKIGFHLRNAQNSFETTDKRLTSVEQKFIQITHTDQPLLEGDGSLNTLDEQKI